MIDIIDVNNFTKLAAIDDRALESLIKQTNNNNQIFYRKTYHTYVYSKYNSFLIQAINLRHNSYILVLHLLYLPVCFKGSEKIQTNKLI